MRLRVASGAFKSATEMVTRFAQLALRRENEAETGVCCGKARRDPQGIIKLFQGFRQSALVGKDKAQCGVCIDITGVDSQRGFKVLDCLRPFASLCQSSPSL